MKIKSLEIENYRRIPKKLLKFSDSFNLIIGDNGSGKTAILDCLSMMAQRLIGEIASKRVTLLKQEDIRVVRYESQTGYFFEKQYPCSVKVEGTHDNFDFSMGEILSYEGRETSFKGKARFKEIAQLVSQGELATKLPIVAYYRTNRLWFSGPKTKTEIVQKIKVKEGRSRLKGYELSSAAALNSRSWVDWFIRGEFSSYNTRQESFNIEALNAFRETIKSTIDECSDIYYDFDYGDLIVVIDKTAIPYTMLSDGQRGIISLFADISFRSIMLNPDVNIHSIRETEGVVFVDEIDLHLHPNWQREIIKKLKISFPKVQFFSTTHSPFIIQSVLPEEVIQMSYTPHYQEFINGSIEDIAENVMRVETPQISERRKEMYQAAEKYYLLLEEGKDKKGVEAQMLKEKLDELISPFSDDIAFTAFLNMERLAKIKNDEGER